MRNSQIILAKDINIDKNYNNVLNYTNTQMLELLQSQAHFVGKKDNCSFLGRENRISTSFTVDECLRANYIAFQNPSYSNKWFFGWIDDVIYKGDSNTEIQFTIDSWSTWFGYWTAKPCWIIREHTNDDTIGNNTVPENLDVGEMIEESQEVVSSIGNQFYFCVLTTYDPVNEDFVGVNLVNNSLFGSRIFCFTGDTDGVIYLRNFLQHVNNKSKIDAISTMFIAPKLLIDNIGTTQRSGAAGPGSLGGYIFYELTPTSTTATSVVTLESNASKLLSFSDYTPKNNKCFVYPYNYCLVSNNIGNNIIYKYEDFYGAISPEAQTIFGYTIEISLSIGCSARLVPNMYKNVGLNYEESIPLAKYPTCEWSSDAFINWLTENGVNIASSIVIGAAGAISAAYTGGFSLLASATAIANLIGQFNKANLLPSIEKGSNNGDVNFSAGKNTFVFHKMRCKTEYLKIIDDYFTRFGYKINRLKVPNMVGRRYFNYIEISDSDEIGTGSVPEKYWGEINNACHRGITIWHNHENVGNFNLDNTIV